MPITITSNHPKYRRLQVLTPDIHQFRHSAPIRVYCTCAIDSAEVILLQISVDLRGYHHFLHNTSGSQFRPVLDPNDLANGVSTRESCRGSGVWSREAPVIVPRF
jgi:hypothetical protein